MSACQSSFLFAASYFISLFIDTNAKKTELRFIVCFGGVNVQTMARSIHPWPVTSHLYIYLSCNLTIVGLYFILNCIY